MEEKLSNHFRHLQIKEGLMTAAKSKPPYFLFGEMQTHTGFSTDLRE
jgi:hypothetical protein